MRREGRENARLDKGPHILKGKGGTRKRRKRERPACVVRVDGEERVREG